MILVFLLSLFACLGGDPDCERRRVFWKDTKIEDGFNYPLPHSRGDIYISQNRTNIARANFKAARPTFDFNDDVIRMDNTSIVTKHFLDTEMQLKYRNENDVHKEDCVIYEVHGGPVESEPMNFTGSFPDNNKRPELRIGVICAVVLWLVVIFAVLWKTLMSDPNRDGTPADCRFIRGQLPTPCPRADGPY